MKFPSQEWGDAFRAALNANPRYAEAAAQWEGDILLRVGGEGADAPSPGIQLALSHGQCTGASYLPSSASVYSEYVFEATERNWGRLLRHEVAPIAAILDRTVRVQGNLPKLMRFTQAAKELVATAAEIPVEA